MSKAKSEKPTQELTLKRGAPDAPAWVTEERIAHTLRVWGKRSKTPLTREDAIDIIVSFGRLVDILKAG